ncbi:hypothetical protein LTR59_011380 [Friedmanniomyces endolithicus]|nr:hypothetical protein LTR94_015907 [Friedmanniomyces endolithicus]KAK0784550.1 hypothetical protein LTR59_011380 [Friedmanniomyces endolithicus]KAK0790160.1 hypothetical protein LTR38_010702 [Friedmanniomyces endolithicus]
MATTNSDRERMAALGARLMGSKIASSPRATPSATAPRSMPTAGKSTDRENMPLFARSVPPEVRITPPGNRAEPTSTTKPASAAIPSTKTSTPVLHERVLNVPEKATASPSKNSSNSLEVGAVPSLHTHNYQSSTSLLAGESTKAPMAGNALRKGDVDALKEAREFAQSISPGKGTSSYAHKAHSSTRRSVAREMYAATSFMAPTFSPKPAEARKPVAAGWQDFASASAPREQNSAITKNTVTAIPIVTDIKTPEPEAKEEPAGLPKRKVAMEKDISKDPAHAQALPPHLREKAAAAEPEPKLSAHPISVDGGRCAQKSGSSMCILSDLTLGIIVNVRRDLDALAKRVRSLEREKAASTSQSKKDLSAERHSTHKE